MSQKGIVYVAVKGHKCNKTANINVKKIKKNFQFRTVCSGDTTRRHYGDVLPK